MDGKAGNAASSSSNPALQTSVLDALMAKIRELESQVRSLQESANESSSKSSENPAQSGPDSSSSDVSAVEVSSSSRKQNSSNSKNRERIIPQPVEDDDDEDSPPSRRRRQRREQASPSSSSSAPSNSPPSPSPASSSSSAKNASKPSSSSVSSSKNAITLDDESDNDEHKGDSEQRYEDDELYEEDVIDADDDQSSEGMQLSEEASQHFQTLLRHLKQHQIEGLRFLWKNSGNAESDKCGGCILADYMGCGKTVQALSFIYLFLTMNPGKRALILCPASVMQHWRNEFSRVLDWASDSAYKFPVYLLEARKSEYERRMTAQAWQTGGGILLSSYDLFRRAITPSPQVATVLQEEERLKAIAAQQSISHQTKQLLGKESLSSSSPNVPTIVQLEEGSPLAEAVATFKAFHECLCAPGPDVVILDEGHKIKNFDSAITRSLRKLTTNRRIILTGHPLQNNLLEYYCMIDFVRPGFLGSLAFFKSRFANDIHRGQQPMASLLRRELARRRAYVLFDKVSPVIMRRDVGILRAALPPKQELVITVRLSPVQLHLYRSFISNLNADGRYRLLFWVHSALTLLCNHPDILKNYVERVSDGGAISSSASSSSSFSSTAAAADGKKRKTREQTIEDEWTSVLGQPSSGSSHIIDPKKLQFLPLDDELDSPDSNNSIIPHSFPSSSSSSSSAASAQQPANVLDVENSGSFSMQADFDITADELGETTASTSRLGRTSANAAANSNSSEEEMYRKEKLAAVSSIGSSFASAVSSSSKGSTGGYKRDMLQQSAKMAIAFDIILQAAAVRDKTVIFSRSLLTLDFFEHMFQKHNSNSANRRIHWSRFDGTVLVQNRQSLIDQFNNPASLEFVFLISTKAGGEGINLTGANRVILMDVNWNPSIDSQSCCRVYRYGQTKPVTVYRLISDGTMEQMIYGRQVNKEVLSKWVVDDSSAGVYAASPSLSQLLYNPPPDPELTADGLLPPPTINPQVNIAADPVLSNMVSTHSDLIAAIHPHDRLFQPDPLVQLSENDKKKALSEVQWQEVYGKQRQQRGSGGDGDSSSSSSSSSGSHSRSGGASSSSMIASSSASLLNQFSSSTMTASQAEALRATKQQLEAAINAVVSNSSSGPVTIGNFIIGNQAGPVDVPTPTLMRGSVSNSNNSNIVPSAPSKSVFPSAYQASLKMPSPALGPSASPSLSSSSSSAPSSINLEAAISRHISPILAASKPGSSNANKTRFTPSIAPHHRRSGSSAASPTIIDDSGDLQQTPSASSSSASASAVVTPPSFSLSSPPLPSSDSNPNSIMIDLEELSAEEADQNDVEEEGEAGDEEYYVIVDDEDEDDDAQTRSLFSASDSGSSLADVTARHLLSQQQQEPVQPSGSHSSIPTMKASYVPPVSSVAKVNSNTQYNKDSNSKSDKASTTIALSKADVKRMNRLIQDLETKTRKQKQIGRLSPALKTEIRNRARNQVIQEKRKKDPTAAAPQQAQQQQQPQPAREKVSVRSILGADAPSKLATLQEKLADKKRQLAEATAAALAASVAAAEKEKERMEQARFEPIVVDDDNYDAPVYSSVGDNSASQKVVVDVEEEEEQRPPSFFAPPVDSEKELDKKKAELFAKRKKMMFGDEDNGPSSCSSSSASVSAFSHAPSPSAVTASSIAAPATALRTPKPSIRTPASSAVSQPAAAIHAVPAIPTRPTFPSFPSSSSIKRPAFHVTSAPIPASANISRGFGSSSLAPPQHQYHQQQLSRPPSQPPQYHQQQQQHLDNKNGNGKPFIRASSSSSSFYDPVRKPASAPSVLSVPAPSSIGAHSQRDHSASKRDIDDRVWKRMAPFINQQPPPSHPQQLAPLPFAFPASSSSQQASVSSSFSFGPSATYSQPKSTGPTAASHSRPSAQTQPSQQPHYRQQSQQPFSSSRPSSSSSSFRR